jgi:hypothetical protein
VHGQVGDPLQINADRFSGHYGTDRSKTGGLLGLIFGRFAADLWSTRIWWRRARFSSCRAARERKIEARFARSDARRISIAVNYEGRDNRHPLINFEIFGRHTVLSYSILILLPGYHK